jgi:Cu/Ag efflux protein CusF
LKTSNVIVALLAAGVVGAGGYWLGGRTHSSGDTAVAGAQSAASAAAGPAKTRKLLYYRNPMGLADTSPTPKKDPMGMDYIAVYEGEDEGADKQGSANQIRISTEKIQKLGVRTEAATMRALGKTVRAAGRVEPDERRIYAVSPKFEGYVERLHRSPVSGVVTEKKALQGMRFMPGESLYQVTDLSSVWVLADVFEQDIGLVKTGAQASVKINAYPDKSFNGKITYIYPTLKPETRTVPVRIELANPGQLLKPAMFAQVEIQVGAKAPVLTIPDSAVIDSGTRRVVLVQLQEGRFEPREVKLGAHSDTYFEVREGVKEGEQVVVAANFLIDAESNLKAAVGGMGTGSGQAAAPSATSAPAAAPAAGSAAGPVAGPVGHKGQGTVDGVDLKAGTVSLNHGAIASLKWPAMTMEFKVANPSLLKDLKPGAPVSFEFVERQPGEWVVTSITPTAAKAAATKSNSGH